MTCYRGYIKRFSFPTMQKIKHAQYFEGILQLRNPSNEVLDFVNSQIQKRSDVFISKSERLKNGIDLYLSSKKYILQIGKKLRMRFGGEVKVSTEHYSTDRITSKDVHRVNLLYRQPPFKKGDIIKLRGDNIKILHIGKKVNVLNLSTGQRINLRYKDFARHS